MPVIRNRTVLEVAKGIKAFLNLEAGLTRGAMTDPAKRLSATPEQDGTPTPSGVQARELEQTRQPLEEREREIARLKARLASSALNARTRSPNYEGSWLTELLAPMSPASSLKT